MSPLDALWHVLNLFAVPALTGLLAASGAKLLWRRDLAGVAWRRLALGAVLACAATALAGLVWLGRDGRIATYGAMLPACAFTLWALGWWWPGSRR